MPALLYGCESLAIREQDKSRITSAEIKWQNTHGKIIKPIKIFYQNLKLTQL